MTLTPVRLAWLLKQGFKYDNNNHYVLFDLKSKPVLRIKALVLEVAESEWIVVQEQLAIVIQELGGTIR